MAKPKAQVEGVYEKTPGSGVWYTRLRVNGKLVRKMIGTHKAAKEYIQKARTIRSTGAGVLPQTAKRPARTLGELEKVGGTVTVGELCDDWLAHIQERAKPVKGKWLYKDQRNPASRIGRIKAHFGDRPAESLLPYEISAWLESLNVSNATQNRYKFTFSGMYRHGQYQHKVTSNPAKYVMTGETSNGVIRFLTSEEEQRIRAILQADIKACPVTQPTIRKRLIHRVCELDVSLGTGMRKGEQYKLQWSDVDFNAREITARDTKNGETRVIPMIDDVRNALLTVQGLGLQRKDRSADQPNQSPDDVVFFVDDNHKWWGAYSSERKYRTIGGTTIVTHFARG